MSESLSSGLEFPAMLHGLTRTVRPKVRAQGQRWAREYLKTGAFTQPRSMLRIAPGELLEMQSAVLFDFVPQDRWRVHMFDSVFLPFDAGLPEEECQPARERLESFCLSTPWGALFHAVSPYPPRSAVRTARRLTALLRFWDVLQGPRYAFWYDREDTLEQLMERIYGKTLEAWWPGGSTSVREHMSLAVERMSRATREDCTEALLRMIPLLLAEDFGFKHRAVLGDFDFLRERLTALPSGDFDSISGACKDPVTLQLADWDRALSRQ